MMIDRNDRPLSACAEAGVVLEGYLAIWTFALFLDFKNALNSVKNLLCSNQMTGRSPANIKSFLAGRCESEVRVERCDTPHLVDRGTAKCCSFFDRFVWEVVNNVLHRY